VVHTALLTIHYTISEDTGKLITCVAPPTAAPSWCRPALLIPCHSLTWIQVDGLDRCVSALIPALFGQPIDGC
jgi:hypothetical protein